MRSIAASSSASDRKRWKSAALLGERGLFALGACCLVLYAAACAHGSFFRFRERRAFEQALVASIQQENGDHSEWSEARRRRYEQAPAEPADALGLLHIPDAAVSVMLLEGTDELTLNRAVGHIEGTALPGRGGNVGIAGHRDSFFRGLRHLEAGDDLSLTTLGGVAHYEVTELQIVEPTAVEVLAPTELETLTLVTCYPFYYVGDAPQRFIVRAQQVRFEPWSRRKALD